jgi:hypothetical protein
MKQARLREVEIENDFLKQDIDHLNISLAKNLDEYGKLVKELANLWKLVEPETEEVVDFEPDFESDFDFDFEFDLDFNPDDKGEE